MQLHFLTSRVFQISCASHTRQRLLLIKTNGWINHFFYFCFVQMSHVLPPHPSSQVFFMIRNRSVCLRTQLCILEFPHAGTKVFNFDGQGFSTTVICSFGNLGTSWLGRTARLLPSSIFWGAILWNSIFETSNPAIVNFILTLRKTFGFQFVRFYEPGNIKHNHINPPFNMSKTKRNPTNMES